MIDGLGHFRGNLSRNGTMCFRGICDYCRSGEVMINGLCIGLFAGDRRVYGCGRKMRLDRNGPVVGFCHGRMDWPNRNGNRGRYRL